MISSRLILLFGLLLYPVGAANAQNYYEEQFNSTADQKAEYNKFYDSQFVAEQKTILTKQQVSDPKNPAPTAALAEISAREGQLIAALNGLSMAINMNAQDNGAGYSRDWIFLDRAAVKSQLGLFESALNDCDSAYFLSSPADRWRVYWLKSIILDQAGRAKEAEGQLSLAQQNARTAKMSNEFFSKKLFAKRVADTAQGSSRSAVLSSIKALSQQNNLPQSSVLQQILSISWLPQNLSDNRTYRPSSIQSPLTGLSINSESDVLSLGINADECTITEDDLKKQFSTAASVNVNETGEPAPWEKVYTFQSGACELEFSFAHNTDQGVQNIAIRWNQSKKLGRK